ncbi:MAG: glyoxylate/hydroxypyruvate reductase A [Alphaproteobacteria bacterium]|nr:glyoxylate/hydroxypyruvate reductase A [Alphaproteobacteria bacterium]
MVVKSGGPTAIPEWRVLFKEAIPDLEIRCWTESGALADIDYAMVWEPEPGRLARMPNLRLILSSAVGVEHILADPGLPRHIPILRTVPPEAADQMAEFVSWAVLHLHRDIPTLQQQQRQRIWKFHDPPLARDRRVGILGMGMMGRRCANALVALGFDVAGWSRTRRSIPKVRAYAGACELRPFLESLDIAVCLLPATPQTQGILGADALRWLKKGACIVNAGRGQQVPRLDLLAAIDSGHVAWAILDVFEQEPLAPEDPLWTHSRVIVTPHVASLPSRASRARFVADAILRFERGERPVTLYDPMLGY